MGLKICSLASGSSGNCVYIGGDKQNLLIDLGVSSIKVERSLSLLNVQCSDVSLLITHSHSDHISNVASFVKKYSCPVYCHYLTKPSLLKKGIPIDKIIEFSDNDFFVGDITVSPFKVSHDVPCVGYSFYNKGKKISIATDLGHVGNSVIKSLQDSDLVFLECNHDEDMLRVNSHYATWLKKRILGESGHLSNMACGDAAVKLFKSGVKSIILGHLSKENNYPELAFSTVREILANNGIIEGRDIKVEVALQDKMSGLYEVI